MCRIKFQTKPIRQRGQTEGKLTAGRTGGASHDAEGHLIQHGNVFAFDADKTGLLETAEQTTDGLDGQPQIVADVATRHGQTKFSSRKSSLRKAGGETVQKCR